MSQDERMRRVSDPASPIRCQHATSLGQCTLEKLAGTNYCLIHGGKGAKVEESRKIRNYRITTYQSRLDEFADNAVFGSLREETAILRLILEGIINQTQGNFTELMMQSTTISDLVIKIEKLITSCKKIEEKSGLLLDRAAALKYGNTLVDIVTRYVTDPEIIDKIVTDYLKEMANNEQPTS